RARVVHAGRAAGDPTRRVPRGVTDDRPGAPPVAESSRSKPTRNATEGRGRGRRVGRSPIPSGVRARQGPRPAPAPLGLDRRAPHVEAGATRPRGGGAHSAGAARARSPAYGRMSRYT